ncbi:MAG: DUF3108 domain-containing protein, partial [Verrucomicrobia bacterium]|nr:DUF3108 domain-containing protein [Verrucomicrobiota bacterium]
WGIVHAAEGTFTATAEHGKEGVQRFDLYLRSRGPIEAFYPIRSRFVSLTQVKPWRSLEYRQDRSEGGNLRTRKTIPEYSVKLGRFWPGPGKPEENFDLPEGPCEDFGSMLYHLRYHPWKKGESIVWNILENKEPLFGRMTCTEIGEIELGDREPRRLIQLRCEPVGASRRHQGWLDLWMTDDERRLPLLAPPGTEIEVEPLDAFLPVFGGGGESALGSMDDAPLDQIGEFFAFRPGQGLGRTGKNSPKKQKKKHPHKNKMSQGTSFSTKIGRAGADDPAALKIQREVLARKALHIQGSHQNLGTAIHPGAGPAGSEAIWRRFARRHSSPWGAGSGQSWRCG